MSLPQYLKREMFRCTSVAAIILTGGLLSGCAVPPLPLKLPQATPENTQQLRSADLAPVAVGNFVLEIGKPAIIDQLVSPRGTPVASLYNGSFSQYLREALRVELDAAGLLDSRAKVSISGELIDSDVIAPIGTGNARLAARFIVKDGATTKYARSFDVRAEWDSSFYGNTAFQTAIDQYQRLYQKLLGRLFSDPAFKAAVAK
ncbi:hypothetical protein [Massilia aerilata]|uniref:Lipoprotein n=1 Tax=Massilia aerilata TaxID=453817 RepID=A0ABW0S070_9BURK